MCLVARRHLQRPGLNFDEIAGRKPISQSRHDAPACQQVRPAGHMGISAPERWASGHIYLYQTICGKDWNRPRRSLWCAPKPRPPAAHKLRIIIVKVIASSLRKGNIVDLDGRLYVVLTAENFHPGKGTPTTQIDMRRISDGVKTSQRYKTTEQVERAHVEDRPYQFLYSDGEGFHFMNLENYDQIQVPADVIGDAKAYLEAEMMVKLSVFEGNAVAIEMPQRATLEVVETEPATKGQTASSSYKPATLSN